MPRIYTRSGDDGETGLLFGGRVSKADPRCEAFGSVDEAVSALGLARSLVKSAKLRDIIMVVQRELFTVGAELATDPSQYAKLETHFRVVTAEAVARLEAIIDELNAEINLPPEFILPGTSAASGALDLSRSILRRAERRVVVVKESGLLPNPEVLKYLNRLADLVFVMARYEDRDVPIETVNNSTP